MLAIDDNLNSNLWNGKEKSTDNSKMVNSETCQGLYPLAFVFLMCLKLLFQDVWSANIDEINSIFVS